MRYQVTARTLHKLETQTELMHEGNFVGCAYVTFDFEKCRIEAPFTKSYAFFDGLSKDEFLLTAQNDTGFRQL